MHIIKTNGSAGFEETHIFGRLREEHVRNGG